MVTLHKMGHHSENLIREQELRGITGAILSPVNYSKEKIHAQVAELRRSDATEQMFDPQLYVPTSERGCLREWPYFPSDVDTADLASQEWWEGVCKRLARVVQELGVSSVCSPAVLPRSFSTEYCGDLVKVGALLHEMLAGTGIGVLQTAVIGLADLCPVDRVMQVASLITQTPTDRVYLVFVSNQEPRRELSDVEELKAGMRLISELRKSGLDVTVGYCSSDMLLWRHAGASACATGKFFNLRRFTRSRFEEPGGGGGQFPYWFEEGLSAFLRESDLVRVRQAHLLSAASTRNPYADEIFRLLDVSPGAAWVRWGWKQYLWWFADADRRIQDETLHVPQLLKDAEDQWQAIEDKILMEEPRNDGSWIRSWRRACLEFAK